MNKYEATDPNAYVTYIKECYYTLEDEYAPAEYAPAEYAPANNKYLKWEQAFYFDRKCTKFAYAEHMW